MTRLFFGACSCPSRIRAASPVERVPPAENEEEAQLPSEVSRDTPMDGEAIGTPPASSTVACVAGDLSACSTRSSTDDSESEGTAGPAGRAARLPRDIKLRRPALGIVAAVRMGGLGGHSWHRPTVPGTAAQSAEGADLSGIRELLAMREPGGSLWDLGDFAKEYGDEAFCRRLLRKYDGDVRRAADGYAKALRWRARNESLLTNRQFVLASDFRRLGADVDQRPVLYMCTKNQLLSSAQGLDQILVCMLEAVDSMPPGVEQMTQIWDLEGFSLRLNYNPSPVVHLLEALEGYFAERLHELIIIDMPRAATFAKDAIWPLVPSKTRQKVKFMTAQQAKVHAQGAFLPETAARVCDSIDPNRDRGLTLEQRRATWLHVDRAGHWVPLAV